MNALPSAQKNMLNTVKSKFILLAMLISFIPMVINSIYSNYNYNRIVSDRFSSVTSNFLGVVNWNLNVMIADIEDISNILLTSQDVQSSLSFRGDMEAENYRTDLHVQDLMINITNNKNYIDLVFIGNDFKNFYNQSYMTTSNFVKIYSELKQTDWYRMVNSSDGKGGVWSKSSAAQIDNKNMLLYGKSLYSLNTLEQIGVMAIGVNRKVFDEMFAHINEAIDYNIIVISNAEVIYSKSDLPEQQIEEVMKHFDTSAGAGSIVETIGPERYLINFITNSRTGWTIVEFTPYAAIVGKNVINLTFVLIPFSFGLSLLVAVLISNKVTTQLKLLRYVIKSVQYNNEIPQIQFDRQDEVGQVGIEFLKMLDTIEALNSNLYKAVIKEKEAELLALQSQINPHFLYNTMNSIFWMAEKINAKNISRMTSSISKMFKLNLNNGKLLTTVSNEIKQIETYLDIQNIRYDNKFDSVIDIEPAILYNRMIKLILQPVVENSIYHGLEPKEGKGHVAITGRLIGEDMVFEVTDDGVGFDSASGNGEGYALKNIDERIKLYYGEDYGIVILSRPGEGTLVRIRIKQNIYSEQDDV